MLVGIHGATLAFAGAAPPLFKQCDPRWGNTTMGVHGPGEQSTICHEGCAMTCVAMALRSAAFTLPSGGAIDPGTLNAWLQAHDGYRCDRGDCNNLVLDAPDRLTNGRFRYVGEWDNTSLSVASVAANIASAEIAYLAHVHVPTPPHGVHHFVLLTSYDNATDSFGVLDPGFDEQRYARSAIHDYLMYEVLPHDAVVPHGYRLFKQCDPAWGSNAIVHKTICAVGCLLTSTTMVLRSKGIQIDGEDATPARLNKWLQTHGGYDDDDDLDEAVVAKIDPRLGWTNESMHTKPDVAWATLVAMLGRGAPVIANVMHGHHFVLVVGYAADGDTLYVNDPGFERSTYSFAADVVGWRLYNVSASAPVEGGN